MPTNDINAAVTFAVNVCNDETHGYAIGGTLNPTIDCSGLVYYALQAGGFQGLPGDRWTTGNMMDYLRAMGFTEAVFTVSQRPDYVPQHGDIWVHSEGTEADPHGHALFYGENVWGYVDSQTPTKQNITKARIEAVSSHNRPGTDDSVNSYGVHNEVWVHYGDKLYSPRDYPDAIWHVFRWGGTPPGPTPTGEFIALILRKKRRRRTFL